MDSFMVAGLRINDAEGMAYPGEQRAVSECKPDDGSEDR